MVRSKTKLHLNFDGILSVKYPYQPLNTYVNWNVLTVWLILQSGFTLKHTSQHNVITENEEQDIVISLLQCAISSDRVSSFLPLAPPTVPLGSVSLRKNPSISRKLVVGSGQGWPLQDTHIPEYSAVFLPGWKERYCSIYAKSPVTAERGR